MIHLYHRLKALLALKNAQMKCKMSTCCCIKYFPPLIRGDEGVYSYCLYYFVCFPFIPCVPLFVPTSLVYFLYFFTTIYIYSPMYHNFLALARLTALPPTYNTCHKNLLKLIGLFCSNASHAKICIIATGYQQSTTMKGHKDDVHKKQNITWLKTIWTRSVLPRRYTIPNLRTIFLLYW
jgi:hypothetical protein